MPITVSRCGPMPRGYPYIGTGHVGDDLVNLFCHGGGQKLLYAKLFC
jgi:hypothetical protein